MLQLRTPWKRATRPGNRGRPQIRKERASQLPSVQVMLSRSLPAVNVHPTQCRRAEREADFRHPDDTLTDPAFFQGVGQSQFTMIGDFFGNLNHHISLEVSILINDKPCWYPFGYAFVASGSKVCAMFPSYATSDVLESNKRHRQKEGYQSPSRSHQRSSRIGDVGDASTML
jgi:hypothetical protein